MRIVITGAAGRIGRQMVRELHGDHDLVLLDRRAPKGSGIIRADLARALPGRRVRGLPGTFPWDQYLDGADAILHLAGNPSPRAPLAEAMLGNVHTTSNLLEVADRLDVPRFVLASSWKAAQRELEACVQAGKMVSDPVPVSPLSAYGLSKAAAEEAGRMAVSAGRVDAFVAVRIGRVVWKPPRPPEDAVGRSCTIGVADLRMLLRLSLERPLNGFHVIYGVSPTSEAVVDLLTTRRLLDWSPNDVPEDPSPRRRVTQTA